MPSKPAAFPPFSVTQHEFIVSLSPMSKRMQSVGVIGGGSWATALVKILCNNLEQVNWFMRNEEAVQHVRKYRHNPTYLQSVEFNLDKIHVSANLIEIIER